MCGDVPSPTGGVWVCVEQATTEPQAAVIVKRLPEWAQFKWRVVKDRTGQMKPLLERRTHWTHTDLKALVPWHQMEGARVTAF